MTEPGNNVGKTPRGRPFAPGNPGRPPGSKHKATLAIEALLEGEAEAIGRKCIERALEGDGLALRLVMERLVPLRRGRLVEFDMPEVGGGADLARALGAVLKATAAGSLTPDEASAIAHIIDTRRRALETAELEQRVDVLEKATR